MNPLITLSMPIYNVEKYVETSLLSALNQTYDNMEILVVDDKGKDHSMDIVRKVIDSHPRGNIVRIIEHEKNMSLGAARNTSIDHAKGEYIVFMDSDDEVSQNCIEVLYLAMKETPVDFVVGSIDEVDENGNLLKQLKYIDAYYSSNAELLQSQYDYRWIKGKQSYRILGTSWNKLYNVDFLRSNNLRFIPFSKGEDDLFEFILLFKANSCRIISIPTYKYKVLRPGSIMHEIRKRYTEFQLKKDLENLEFYASYIVYIREHTGNVAKYILSTIIKRGTRIKHKSKQLKYSYKDNKVISNKISCLTEDIGFSEIPLKLDCIFPWLYLKSPAFLDPVFDFFYSKIASSKH